MAPVWNRLLIVYRLDGHLAAAKLALVGLLVAGLTNALGAQVKPGFSFEVASVKAAPERDYGSGSRPTGMAPEIQGNPARIDFTDVSLVGVICRAYGLRPADLKTQAWMEQRRYDIHANVPASAPKGHIPEMLENLLADRFQMKVHWETHQEPGYVLTVGGGGLKLKKSAVDALHMASFRSDGHFELRRFTMTELASSLRGSMGRPVVNSTGVAGEYDIVFEAAPDSMPGLPPGLVHSNGQPSGYPTIFAALRRLGLELTPAGKAPVKYLVVDSALKMPTGN